MNDSEIPGQEGEVRDAERLALEVRRLAHDVNNALMPLMMGVSVLRRKMPDPALERTLTNMESSARRAADLANEILALARRYSPKS